MSKGQSEHPGDLDLSASKIGSFDAEFDLLESTLCEDHEDSDHGVKISITDSNSVKCSYEDNSKTKKLNNKNTSDSKLSVQVQKTVFDDNFYLDTCSNRPDSVNSLSLHKSQHCKSIFCQENSVILKDSEPGFPQLDSNTKFDIIDSSSSEAIRKTVLIVECDQTNNKLNTAASDINECDRPHCIPLQCSQVISSNIHCSDSLSSRGEQVTQATTCSDIGCDVNKVANPNLHETLVNCINTSGCLPQVAETMGDSVIPDGDVSGHPDGHVTVIADTEINNSKELYSEIPQLVDILDKDALDRPTQESEIIGPSIQEECLESGMVVGSDPLKVKCETENGLQVNSQVSNETIESRSMTNEEILSGAKEECLESEIFVGTTPLKVECETSAGVNSQVSNKTIEGSSMKNEEILSSVKEEECAESEIFLGTSSLKVNCETDTDIGVDSQVSNVNIDDKSIKKQEILPNTEKECLESDIFMGTTPLKVKCETSTGVDSQISNENIDVKSTRRQGIVCSTPNVIKKLQEDFTNQTSDAEVADFGLMSPLDIKCKKQNLKRKYIGLQTIEEIDEDSTITEKKTKVVEDMDPVNSSIATAEASTSSTIPCFEAPARSLLKKWQPSCLSRNVSTSSFIILDECGETEMEDYPNFSQEHESSRADGFEIACQSLNEVLMKSSSNIETLEKYHSQVQLENQIDDEKFDEILKELTMHVDLDDETCLSVKSMDISRPNQLDETTHTQEAARDFNDIVQSGPENKLDKGPQSDTSVTGTEGVNECLVKENVQSVSDKIGSLKSESLSGPLKSSNNASSETVSNKDKPSISNEEVLDIDEEDFLLDENISTGTKEKAYEFFEFVSTDPKENEDNYNPEWQKLGRLTCDEERYKAVRDRWRSLVPPDPNRNLTFRQWRARNNKPPIKLSSLNNNHQLMDDNEKNQLCTAVFDNKIGKIVQELEDSRMNIYRQRNREFEELGRVQDDEQIRASMNGFNHREMARLHGDHLNQCRAVKNQYDQELKRIHELTEGKIRILKEAKEEVLLFQKFYKGVGARDDNEMYMTDTQVQELMETEEMLEQYRILYK